MPWLVLICANINTMDLYIYFPFSQKASRRSISLQSPKADV
jgi:hypothetical protein